MRKVKIGLWTLIGALTLWGAAAYAEEKPSPWETDIAAGREKAAKESKNVMIFYVGEDDDMATSLLDKSLMTKDEFLTEMTAKYILVKIKIPKEQAGMPEADFKKLFEEGFKVGLYSYPTVVLTDSKGRSFGIMRKLDDYFWNNADGSQLKQFSGFIKQFETAKTLRDVEFAKAEKAVGAEKAKALNLGMFWLQKMAGIFDGLSLFGYDEEIDALIKADPENVSGFSIEWQYRVAVVKARKHMLMNDYKAAITVCDEFLAVKGVDQKFIQSVMYNKAQIFALAGDDQNCIRMLLDVVKLDPASEVGKEAQKVIDEIVLQQAPKP